MRGLQNDGTATEFNNRFRAFYNHIRPHQALDGKTPGQAAGITFPSAMDVVIYRDELDRLHSWQDRGYYNK